MRDDRRAPVMDRFQAFWEVHGENKLLVFGYAAFLFVLLVWMLRHGPSRKPWEHMLVFLAYACWTFHGLLFEGGEGSSLVYLFYGALPLLMHAVLLTFLGWHSSRKRKLSAKFWLHGGSPQEQASLHRHRRSQRSRDDHVLPQDPDGPAGHSPFCERGSDSSRAFSPASLTGCTSGGPFVACGTGSADGRQNLVRAGVDVKRGDLSGACATDGGSRIFRVDHLPPVEQPGTRYQARCPSREAGWSPCASRGCA